MSSRLVPRISIILIGAFLVGSGCGGTGLATKTDAESGTGGNLASGGAAATGGATGSGGMSTSGSGGTGAGPIGSGGIDSDSCSGLYPNNSNCGGAGGNPGTGGIGNGAGGAASTGGIVSTGGTRSTGGAGGSGGSVIDGGSTTGCSCAGGTTTFDCFCSVHSCARTLSSFTADAGAGGGYSTLEEYGNCNLVVVTVATGLAGGVYVFDRTTGRLVGERYESDVPDACPFDPDASSYRTLSAGQFPDATCVRSECLNGIFPAISACPDAGI